MDNINDRSLEQLTNTQPQQMGVLGRDGRIPAGITICLPKDSGLPKLLPGELVFTAAYLASRTPHSALNMGTPYEGLYGKEATLQHLRTIDCRVLVHIDGHTKNPEGRFWESRLRGYSPNTKAHRLYSATGRSVVLRRVVVFIEMLSNEVSLSVNKPDNIDKMDDDGSMSYHVGPTNDATLRDT